jgi:CRP-like cAMP-binding protein
MNTCKNCNAIEKTPFCSLPKNELENIDQSKKILNFKTGDSLFRHGDASEGLYCISKGIVKILDYDKEGRSIMLQVNQAGSVVGYRSLFTKTSHVTHAVAQTDLQVCFIPKNAIYNLLEANPPLAVKFLANLSEDLYKSETRMSQLAYTSATERIAEALIVLKSDLDDTKWTRKDIADWAGTSPETVIRTLAKFEADGLIKQEGRSIAILDKNALSNFIPFQ